MKIRNVISIILVIGALSLCIAYSWINGKPDIGMLAVFSPFIAVVIVVSLVISKIIKSFHASIIILIVCTIAWIPVLVDDGALGLGAGIILLSSALLVIVPAILSIINILKKTSVIGSIIIIIISILFVFITLKYCQWIDSGGQKRDDQILNPIFAYIAGGPRNRDQK